MAKKPKDVFVLEMTGPSEDVPRAIRRGGRCCGGEFALVLVPGSPGDSVYAHVEKGGGAKVWRGRTGSDAPSKPETELRYEDAVAFVKRAEAAVPASPGRILTRGAWRAAMRCDDGHPVIELRRKVAAYTTVVVKTAPGNRGGWLVGATRDEKWWAKQDAKGWEHVGSLGDALVAALRAGVALVGSVCAVKETSRRAAFDEVYGAAHPVRPDRERGPVRVPAEPRAPKGKKGKERSTRPSAEPTPTHEGPSPALLDIKRRNRLSRFAREISNKASTQGPLFDNTASNDEIIAWLKWNDRDGEYDNLGDLAWEALGHVLEDYDVPQRDGKVEPIPTPATEKPSRGTSRTKRSPSSQPAGRDENRPGIIRGADAPAAPKRTRKAPQQGQAAANAALLSLFEAALNEE